MATIFTITYSSPVGEAVIPHWAAATTFEKAVALCRENVELNAESDDETIRVGTAGQGFDGFPDGHFPWLTPVFVTGWEPGSERAERPWYLIASCELS